MLPPLPFILRPCHPIERPTPTCLHTCFHLSTLYTHSSIAVTRFRCCAWYDTCPNNFLTIYEYESVVSVVRLSASFTIRDCAAYVPYLTLTYHFPLDFSISFSLIPVSEASSLFSQQFIPHNTWPRNPASTRLLPLSELWLRRAVHSLTLNW